MSTLTKTVFATTLACLAGLSVGASALRGPAPTPAEAGLERIASYAGDWYGNYPLDVPGSGATMGA